MLENTYSFYFQSIVFRARYAILKKSNNHKIETLHYTVPSRKQLCRKRPLKCGFHIAFLQQCRNNELWLIYGAFPMMSRYTLYFWPFTSVWQKIKWSALHTYTKKLSLMGGNDSRTGYNVEYTVYWEIFANLLSGRFPDLYFHESIYPPDHTQIILCPSLRHSIVAEGIMVHEDLVRHHSTRFSTCIMPC